MAKAETLGVVDGIREFNAAWGAFGGGAERILQARYITDNPNELGKKDLLDTAGTGDVYDNLHAKYHPKFREYLQDFGYYDIFLFNTEGDLVYSVFKELDYATNVVDGKWRDSGLGRIFRSAMELGSSDEVAFDDLFLFFLYCFFHCSCSRSDRQLLRRSF